MSEGLRGWYILELMGHRRLAGHVTEETIAGAGFLRIDVPGETEGDPVATQFYPPSSVYCMTPTTEAMARQVARSCQPRPVQRWELPEQASTSGKTIYGLSEEPELDPEEREPDVDEDAIDDDRCPICGDVDCQC